MNASAPDRASDPIVGVDLGGTNMQLGVVARDQTILAQLKKKTRAKQGPDAVFERLVAAIQEVCEQAGVESAQLAGLGLAVAAAVDHNAGVVLEAPNIGWREFPIADALRDRLGAPVVLENDVNAAVVGEHRFGVIQCEQEALGVWVGTGVGGAIILGGSLHRGALGTAGEIGHMTLLPGAATGMRKLEDSCSRSAIVQRLARLARGQETVLHELATQGVGTIKSRLIAQAYEANDALTRTVVDESADLLGVSVGSAATLLAVPVVVLGGGLTEAIGEPFVSRVRSSVHRNVFPQSGGAVRVVASTLEEKAGILGAAAIARDRLAAEA